MTTQIPSSSGSRSWRRGAFWFVTFGSLHVFAAALLSAERYVGGELIVKFRGGPKGAEARAVRATLKHEVKRDFDFIGWQHVRLQQGVSVAEGVLLYRALPEVLAVEPNIIFTGGTAPPNDPMLSQQYGLAKIVASNAWNMSVGDSNIVVAILDSGINYFHEDLAPNMWRNPGEIPGNGIDDDDNGYVDDVFGIDTADDPFGHDANPMDQGIPGYHGSVIAGLIGAASNNGKGVAGLNWNIQLMALRFLRTTNYAELAEELEALEYILKMKQRGVNLRVLNISYGSTEFSLSSEEAHQALSAAGVLQVAIAGNNGANIDAVPYYPAASPIDDLISVAASDSNDSLASFSSYGRTNVDLAAPGVGIISTAGPGTNEYYGLPGRDGTSFSAPHIAGAAALLFSAYSSATPLEVKAALLDSVDVLPAFTNRVVSNGRLNVGRAMQLLGERLTNAPPNITFQPQDRTIVVSNSFSFSAVATGARPLSFQWLRDGTLVGDATNTMLLNAAGAEGDGGSYVLMVSNAFGVMTSAVAQLTVLTTPAFLANPQNRGGPETSNVIFTALATGYLPQYHWQFFGTNLPGRTGTNLMLTNISTAMEGPYAVVASNAYGMTTSSIAALAVFTFPRMVEPTSPLRIDAVAGERITFSVRTTGSLPMGYRWRRSGLGMVLTNTVLHENECVFTTTVTNSATWTVILTNVAQPNSNLQRTNAIITIVSDADGDGLPDNWEAVYPEAADAAGDTDGDGMTNLEEYRAGTNPTNVISALRIASLVRNGSALDLSFVAISNKSYAVEQRSLVHTGAWSRLFSVVGAGITRLIDFAPTNDASSQQQYYRVRQR